MMIQCTYSILTTVAILLIAYLLPCLEMPLQTPFLSIVLYMSANFNTWSSFDCKCLAPILFSDQVCPACILVRLSMLVDNVAYEFLFWFMLAFVAVCFGLLWPDLFECYVTSFAEIGLVLIAGAVWLHACLHLWHLVLFDCVSNAFVFGF